MSNNTLINRIQLPGVRYALPSQGIFYTNGELAEDVTNGEVEIFPMSSLDELTFSSPDKLLSGQAISEVFERCIPQIQKPLLLLTKDVDFLMVALRMVTFGNIMEVKHTHTCPDAKSHIHKADLTNIIKLAKKIDPTTISNEYTVSLPNGQQVKLKPMNYKTLLSLYESTLSQKTEDLTFEQMEFLISSTLASVIDNVDDVTDNKQISEWIFALPLGWKKIIEEAINNISEWGVDFSVKSICPDCNEEITIGVTANPVSFFFQ